MCIVGISCKWVNMLSSTVIFSNNLNNTFLPIQIGHICLAMGYTNVLLLLLLYKACSKHIFYSFFLASYSVKVFSLLLLLSSVASYCTASNNVDGGSSNKLLYLYSFASKNRMCIRLVYRIVFVCVCLFRARSTLKLKYAALSFSSFPFSHSSPLCLLRVAKLDFKADSFSSIHVGFDRIARIQRTHIQCVSKPKMCD